MQTIDPKDQAGHRIMTKYSQERRFMKKEKYLLLLSILFVIVLNGGKKCQKTTLHGLLEVTLV